MLLTRAPLTRRSVRLACVRHAANVHPEPGSNSPYFVGLFPFLGQLSHLQYAIVNLPAELSVCFPRSQRGHILRLFLYPRQGGIWDKFQEDQELLFPDWDGGGILL